MATKLFWALVVLVVAALIANGLAGLLSNDQWAVDAAEAACRERGLQQDDVNAVNSKIVGTVIGKDAEIQFKGTKEGRPITIHVTLRKPIHFMEWRVSDVREE